MNHLFFCAILYNKNLKKNAKYFQYARFAFIVPCFESERNQERKKHCINQRNEKSFLFTFLI